MNVKVKITPATNNICLKYPDGKRECWFCDTDFERNRCRLFDRDELGKDEHGNILRLKKCIKSEIKK